MFEKKFITRNALLTAMKSRPREHARKEGFKSISSNASSICHKTSKLFLITDILHLVHCFKICFNLVLPLPTESSVNWSNKHVFVRRNCEELWGNLRWWYLVNGHGDLSFLFYISKRCTIDNNLWKFDKNRMLNFISGEWLKCSQSTSYGLRSASSNYFIPRPRCEYQLQRAGILMDSLVKNTKIDSSLHSFKSALRPSDFFA